MLAHIFPILPEREDVAGETVQGDAPKVYGTDEDSVVGEDRRFEDFPVPLPAFRILIEGAISLAYRGRRALPNLWSCTRRDLRRATHRSASWGRCRPNTSGTDRVGEYKVRLLSQLEEDLLSCANSPEPGSVRSCQRLRYRFALCAAVPSAADQHADERRPLMDRCICSLKSPLVGRSDAYALRTRGADVVGSHPDALGRPFSWGPSAFEQTGTAAVRGDPYHRVGDPSARRDELPPRIGTQGLGFCDDCRGSVAVKRRDET